MAYARRSRHVEIFNFSFLDILACTIGLLIFILVMIFLLQSATRLTDYKKMIQSKLKTVRELQAEEKSTAAITSAIKSQLSSLPDLRNPLLLQLLQTARAEMLEARRNAYVRTSELSSLQAGIDSQRAIYAQQTRRRLITLRQQLATAMRQLTVLQGERSSAQPAALSSQLFFQPINAGRAKQFNILHILCTRGEVKMLKVGQNGAISISSTTGAGDLADSGSAYQRAIGSISQKDHPLVIFWIEPNGIGTFSQAKGQLPDGEHYGYEPALSRWRFLLRGEGKK